MDENAVTPVEVVDWLRAFGFNRFDAFMYVPNRVYAFLRGSGLLDAEHDLTPEGKVQAGV
jgi:hypothetical protein